MKYRVIMVNSDDEQICEESVSLADLKDPNEASFLLERLKDAIEEDMKTAYS